MNQTGISRLNEDNFGGGNYILIANAKWVDVYPRILNHNISEDITLLEDYDWQRFDFTKETLKFSSEEIIKNSAEAFNNLLTGIIPKDRLIAMQKLFSWRNARVVCIYVDANGTAKVLGSKLQPAIFKVPKIDHKDAHAARNETLVTISWPTVIPSPFYQGTIPEEGGTTPVYELTCSELNDINEGLTDAQREVINCIPPIASGQTTSYFTGDDGDDEYGLDFFVLDCNNPFGNTNRFTDLVGGQTYADDIMIDWRRKHMIYMNVLGTYPDWDSAMAACLALTAGGFSWRPITRKVMDDLIRAQNDCLAWSPLGITGSPYANIWYSTTNMQNTTQAYRLIPVTGEIVALGKAVPGVYAMAYRRFTYAELGL